MDNHTSVYNGRTQCKLKRAMVSQKNLKIYYVDLSLFKIFYISPQIFLTFHVHRLSLQVIHI